jgi:DNA-binding transcriptional LysR family regulator
MTVIADKMAGLVAFISAVETGSFSVASERLGTTPSAISKSVARLEQRLGAKLFRRSTRSLTLTVEGTAYYERAVPLLRGLEDAEEVVRSASTARGMLRITMPSELGRLLMNGLTNGFLPRHPEIRLEIGMTDRSVDLIREGYDLALRAGRLADSDLSVRTLGELPMALVASPEHLEHNGRPGSLEDLSRAAHVRYMLGGRPFPKAAWISTAASRCGWRRSMVLASPTSCAARLKRISSPNTWKLSCLKNSLSAYPCISSTLSAEDYRSARGCSWIS